MTPPTLHVILVKNVNRGDKMKLVSKIMKVGGSYTVIIPPNIIREMKLMKRDLVVITYNADKMEISKLTLNIHNNDKD